MCILPPRNVPAVANHAGGVKVEVHLSLAANNGVTLDMQVHYRLLKQAQVRLVLEYVSNGVFVTRPIGLGTSSPDCWTLAGIEHAKVDAR